LDAFFLSTVDNPDQPQSAGVTFSPGQTVYCYYVLNDLVYRLGRGIPYQSQVHIKQGDRVIQRGRMTKHNAQPQQGSFRDRTVMSRTFAQKSLVIPVGLTPGSYTAVLTHRDLNSSRVVEVSYPFTVVAAKPQPLPGPVLDASFLSIVDNPDQPKSAGATLAPGQTVYCYYVLNDLVFRTGLGIPFLSQVNIMQGNRVIQRGYKTRRNAQSPHANIPDRAIMSRAFTGQSLAIPMGLAPGSYTAVLTHNDLNSNQVIEVSYPFTVPTPTIEPKPEPLRGPVLAASYLSTVDNPDQPQSAGTTLTPGQKVYCYYVLNNLIYRTGHGIPYQSQVNIRQGGRVIQSGYKTQRNAQSPQANIPDRAIMSRAFTRQSLVIPTGLAPGSYTAVLTHNDLNASAVIEVTYPFTVALAEPKPRPKPETPKNLLLIEAFLVADPKASKLTPRNPRARLGENLHFYIKVANARYTKARGIPYSTRLVIHRHGRMFRDFGWKAGNGMTPRSTFNDRYFDFMAQIPRTIALGREYTPGPYSAFLTLRDENTGRTLSAEYTFQVTPAQAGPKPKPQPKPQPKPEKPDKVAKADLWQFVDMKRLSRGLDRRERTRRLTVTGKEGDLTISRAGTSRGRGRIRQYEVVERFRWTRPPVQLKADVLSAMDATVELLSSKGTWEGKGRFFIDMASSKKWNPNRSGDLGLLGHKPTGTAYRWVRTPAGPVKFPGRKKGLKELMLRVGFDSGSGEYEVFVYTYRFVSATGADPGPVRDPIPPVREKPKTQTGIWQYVKTDMVETAPKDRKLKVRRSGREGNMTVSRTIPKQGRTRKTEIVEQLIWTPPAKGLTQGQPLVMRCTPRRLQRRGTAGAEGSFRADVVFSDIPLSKAGAILLGRNEGGNGDSHAYYRWKPFAAKVPAGGPGKTQMTLRVVFTAGDVEYAYLYRYQWVRK